MKCESCGMSVGDVHSGVCKLFIPLTEVTADQIATGSIKITASPETPDVGDCYDHDSGEYLGTLTGEEDKKFTSLPACIEVYFDGHWYLYTAYSRVKHEDNLITEEKKQT